MHKYVYTHTDPRTGLVRYVGQGSKARAWACGSASLESGKRGNRLRNHQLWIDELLALGYTPGDFVTIVAQRLSNLEAHRMERDLLNTFPEEQLFNGYLGSGSLKMTAEKAQLGRAVRERGGTWDDAAKAAGVSKMTIWRALTHRTKGSKKW